MYVCILHIIPSSYGEEEEEEEEELRFGECERQPQIIVAT
jgi:hypothetical protein